jgi:predicted RNase H-like HicB family nuclease
MSWSTIPIPGCTSGTYRAGRAPIVKGATLDELRQNLREVVEMLLEDGEPKLEAEFIGFQIIQVA